jgi:hypothetical protein
LGNWLKKSTANRGFDSKNKLATKIQAKEKEPKEAKLDQSVNTMQK